MTITGTGLMFQVVANGTLMILGSTGDAIQAYAPNRWVTVNTPPI